MSEVLRAGIESVHPSQRAAARSLGLSHGQTMQYVVVPQAVRRVMPPLLNDLVALIKDTGLISVLGVVYDAVLNAQIETAQTFNYTPYVVAGVLFVLITDPADPADRLGRPTAGLDRRRRSRMSGLPKRQRARAVPADRGAAQVLRRHRGAPRHHLGCPSTSAWR